MKSGVQDPMDVTRPCPEPSEMTAFSHRAEGWQDSELCSRGVTQLTFAVCSIQILHDPQAARNVILAEMYIVQSWFFSTTSCMPLFTKMKSQF